jgi:hypothetical protein
MLELRGLPTTVLGLVRLHMEKSLAPRGLFLPFQLGRPLGEPGDAAFQKRVLVAALSLLDRADGPFIIEDFPEQAPSWADQPGWRPPFELPKPAVPLPASGWAAPLAAELTRLEPHHAAAKARFGRSTVGTSRMAPAEWPGFIAAFISGAIPASPNTYAPALALRYAVDDLKAYYCEAAQSGGPQPSARQVDQWFWRETAAGLALQALRLAALSSEHNAFKTVGSRFFVPAPYVAPLPA